MIACWQAGSKEDWPWCLVDHCGWYIGELTSHFECGPTLGREDFLAVGDLWFSQSFVIGCSFPIVRLCCWLLHDAGMSFYCLLQSEHLLSQTGVGRTTAGSCRSSNRCARHWFETEGATSRPGGQFSSRSGVTASYPGGQLSSRSGVTVSCPGGRLLCCVGLM